MNHKQNGKNGWMSITVNLPHNNFKIDAFLCSVVKSAEPKVVNLIGNGYMLKR